MKKKYIADYESANKSILLKKKIVDFMKIAVNP